MNGMQMLLSSMGIDPSKIAEDFNVLKDQVVLTLKQIESKLGEIQSAQARLEEIQSAQTRLEQRMEELCQKNQPEP